MPKINDELFKQFISKLNELNFTYWLDCGALLTTYREGFFPVGQDIDVGINGTINPDIINELNTVFPSNSYEVTTDSYHDLTRSIKIRDKKSRLSVDIMHYYFIDDFAVTPHPSRNRMQLSFMQKTFERLLNLGYRLTDWITPFNVRKYWFPWSIIYKGMYCVPRNFFENLESHEHGNVSYNRPRDIEDYLTYRYGTDWNIPQKKWRTSIDDNSFRKRFPEEKFRDWTKQI